MAQVRSDGVLEKRFEQRFPLDSALFKSPLLSLFSDGIFQHPSMITNTKAFVGDVCKICCNSLFRIKSVSYNLNEEYSITNFFACQKL
jgi:hypothetical protein